MSEEGNDRQQVPAQMFAIKRQGIVIKARVKFWINKIAYGIMSEDNRAMLKHRT